MPRLIMLRGLPASGKSTRALELIKADGNAYQVNRDSIREMLYGAGGKWSGRRENLTRHVERDAAARILKDGYNVVVSDCNLTEGHRQSWSQFAQEHGAKFEVEDMGVGAEECVRRDLARSENEEQAVGPAVIWSMALRAGMVTFEKPVVIFDLDGTLADTSERLHHVRTKPKDWHGFHKAGAVANPRWPVVEWARALHADSHEVIVVSGRPSDYQYETYTWLHTYLHFSPKLFMRQSGDRRDDTEVKQAIFDNLPKDSVAFAVDDRPRILALWRQKGVRCYPVGDDNGLDF